MQSYSGKALREEQPHIYAIAEAAYRAMVRSFHSGQSVVEVALCADMLQHRAPQCNIRAPPICA